MTRLEAWMRRNRITARQLAKHTGVNPPVIHTFTLPGSRVRETKRLVLSELFRLVDWLNDNDRSLNPQTITAGMIIDDYRIAIAEKAAFEEKARRRA